MKLTKFLITSLAFVTIGSTSLFAMAASTAGTDTSTDTTGTSSDATVTTTTALDSATGNSGDNVKIIGSVAANPLVTSLYYNSTPITKDTDEPTYIYDADWDVQTGFTTDTFSVALEGSTGDETESQLEVAITASPFYLSTSNDTVYAGNVTIAQKSGASTEKESVSSAPGSNASLTIYSAALKPNTYYNGLYSSDPDLGEANGVVAGFTITANELSDRTLPSGRYVSTVTLAYSIE